MKGLDLISRALRMIGALASGEPPTAAEAADAQTALNFMLEAWGAERLQVFTIARNVYNLVAGKQSYQLGVGGDFNSPRPPRIQYWSPISNANPLYPVELDAGDLLTDAEWKDVRVKNIANPIPRALFDHGDLVMVGNNPTRTLIFWPVPSDSTTQVALYSWEALNQFTDLVTDVAFPPGYMEAITYNLAVRLAAEWPGILSDDARQLARTSLARIRSFNLPEIKLKCDEALTGESGGYNWLTDNQ